MSLYIPNFSVLDGIQDCTEVGFVRFLSGGFTTMAVMNPPEKKLAKDNSVQYGVVNLTLSL